MKVDDPSFSLNTLILITTLVGGLVSGTVSVVAWSFRAAETKSQLEKADKDINTAIALVRRDIQQNADEIKQLRGEVINRRNLLFKLINHLNNRGLNFKFQDDRNDEII